MTDPPARCVVKRTKVSVGTRTPLPKEKADRKAKVRAKDALMAKPSAKSVERPTIRPINVTKDIKTKRTERTARRERSPRSLHLKLEQR